MLFLTVFFTPMLFLTYVIFDRIPMCRQHERPLGHPRPRPLLRAHAVHGHLQVRRRERLQQVPLGTLREEQRLHGRGSHQLLL